MRIINRTEFLKLPEKTLYRKYQPQTYGELSIKYGSLANDYVDVELVGDIEGTDSSDSNSGAHDYYKNTSSVFRFDYEGTCRDGLYDDDQLFAVYDNTDIEQLIEQLKSCIK